MDGCNIQADNVFGPRVAFCRDGFDFTLLFEQSILSALPSALLTGASAGCIFYLSKENIKTKPGASWSVTAIKQATIACFALVQLALIVLWASPANGPTRLSLPASVLSLLAGLALGAVSYLQHSRSVRPSAVLNVYLAISILFDIAQARTLWLREDNAKVASVFTTGLVLKALVLVAEMIEKRRFLQAPYCHYPPEALGSVLNRSVFWWINSLLIKGSSTRLYISDLFNIDNRLTSKYIMPRFSDYWKKTNKQNSYALMWTSFGCFWLKVVTIIVFRLGLIGFKFSQPLLINRAVSLLQEPDGQDKANTGRALVGATALIYIGIALLSGACRHNIYRLLTMIRCGLISLIYNATMGVDTTTAQESAALTLMSTDIECIGQGLEVFDSIFADPIEMGIAAYLLYSQIGLTFLAPLLTSLLLVSLPIALRDVSATAQKEWLNAIERRVASTASIIGNIKAIKMTGLSDCISEKIQASRISELQVSGKFRKVLGVSVGIGSLSQSAIPVFTLIPYAMVMKASGTVQLDTAKAFTTLSLVSLLAYPIQNMAQAAPRIAAGAGCFQRIQEYVLSCDQDGPGSDVNPSSRFGKSDNDVELRETSVRTGRADNRPVLAMENADFAFSSTTDPILRGIDISLAQGTWTILIGPVGSGKTVLLLALLRELKLVRGSLYRHPASQVGYCAQDPWLPNLSIRQIVMANQEFDEVWYSTVVDACVLGPDLNSLPAGDETVIGSNGVSLSGGQKQRVSLARAIYSRKPFLILDDVLSGLDPTTEQAIVDNVFANDGVLRKQDVTVLLATHSVRHARRADHVVILAKGGTISQQGPPSQVREYLKEAAANLEPSSDGSSPPTFETPSAAANAVIDRRSVDDGELQNDIDRQTGDIRLYLYYFKSIGWANCVGIGISLLAFSTFLRFPTLWVRWWSEAEQRNPGRDTGMYAGIYGLFFAICLLSFMVAIYLLFGRGIPRSSNQLHASLLKAVMNAPYWFFVETDTGDIVTKFSQDMSLVCLALPFTFVDTLFNFGVCLVGAILITLASKWSAMMLPIMTIILYTLQKFYLRTSRQIRLLDLEAKAPLYSHFLETLRGITTIKAFDWQQISSSENAALLDESQRPYYLMYCVQRWLNLVLDLLVAGIATIIVVLATHVNDTSAGALGVSLLNILSFSQDLTYLVRTWTDMETSLGAIARVKTFETTTPNEHSLSDKIEPPAEWPASGKIELKSLSSCYKSNSDPVLKDISLEIPPGTKVGICGRTGSGKSTFILTLLGLAQVESGDVELDSISIKDVDLNTTRLRTIAVPQDPLLLPGTVRFNMDPLLEHDDATIASSLEEVGILDTITSRGGLDAQVDSISLSRGQQQLFCLARATLSNSRIVLLDEMTSSVDAATAAKMMDVVGKKFEGRTIVAVAHHLETLRDFDMIIVLDKGKMIETGSPSELLGRQSVFRELWERRH